MGKNSVKCGKTFPPFLLYKSNYLNILDFFNTYFWRVEKIYTRCCVYVLLWLIMVAWFDGSTVLWLFGGFENL